jgi:F-type H+-transporting ATPase subunit b
MRSAAAALFALLLVAAPAHAASGGEFDAKNFILTAINLLILIGVLFYVGRKPIREFFNDRRLQIREDLDSAAKLRDEAEARFTEWQRRLVDLDAELDQLRARARERAEAERERILEAAATAADRVREDARAAIDHETRRAQALLREEASDLAIELAAGLLGREVTDADRGRLVDEFISRIEQPATGAGDGSGSGS